MADLSQIYPDPGSPTGYTEKIWDPSDPSGTEYFRSASAPGGGGGGSVAQGVLADGGSEPDYLEQAYERSYQFNQQKLAQELGIAKAELDMRYKVAKLQAKTAAEALAVDKWYKGEQLKLAHKAHELDQMRLGFDMIREQARMGGPADHFQASDMALGFKQAQMTPEILNRLWNNQAVPAFQQAGGIPVPQTAYSIGQQLGISPAGVGANYNVGGVSPAIANLMGQGSVGQGAVGAVAGQSGGMGTGTAASGPVPEQAPGRPDPVQVEANPQIPPGTPAAYGNTGVEKVAKGKKKGKNKAPHLRVADPQPAPSPTLTTGQGGTSPAVANLFAQPGSQPIDRAQRDANALGVIRDTVLRGAHNMAPGVWESTSDDDKEAFLSGVHKLGGSRRRWLEDLVKSRPGQGTATAA